jgi:hypothetical protein
MKLRIHNMENVDEGTGKEEIFWRNNNFEFSIMERFYEKETQIPNKKLGTVNCTWKCEATWQICVRLINTNTYTNYPHPQSYIHNNGNLTTGYTFTNYIPP